EAELLGSNDGEGFTSIQKLKKVRTGKYEWAVYNHFEEQKFKYYRFKFNVEINIKEVNISPLYLVDNLYGRTAMARTDSKDFESIGSPSAEMIIDNQSLIDVSKYVDEKGIFKGNLPTGNWTIMRFGITSTGAYNNPASKEGRGLEVDKLNREDFKKHYDAFVKKVVIASKPVAPNAFQYVEIDSYEMGGQNWTDDFDDLFQERFGYDLVSFMPLFAGKFVENETVSEGVLQDIRSLISDLMTNNYFGYFQELAHKDGLKTYIENYGFGPLNDLDVGSKADMPMGEFWMEREITQVASPVSAAHIYGKNLISAESFTSTPEINWKANPAMAKISGDKAWALGINEFMFHRFAHQANTHVTPGMTMNRWGFHMDRTQTWWYNAGAAWFKYIARGSYLLRQGVPVSDLLVFVGDESPNSVIDERDFKPRLPHGIKYDNVNSDVLLNRLTVKNNQLVLPEGTAYKALVIKNSKYITLKTLERLKELSKQGAIIIGDKPQFILGYHPAGEDLNQFNQLLSEIWSNENTFEGYDWSTILPKTAIKKDFEIEGRKDIAFIHRRDGDNEIYFSYNPDSVARTFKIKFNVQNKSAELWNPIDGSIKKVAQYREKDGFTHVSIDLLPEQSFFIVFKPTKNRIVGVNPERTYKGLDFSISSVNTLLARVENNGRYKVLLNNGKTLHFGVGNLKEPLEIDGAWKVKFDGVSGYKGEVDFAQLIDWKNHPKDSIKYYSGTATYRKQFEIPASFLREEQSYTLDLGQVSIVAEVKLNGKDLGVLWMPPFKVDISDHLKVGKNSLEIKVTNQWSNHLIGDERYPKQDGGYQLESHNPQGKMPQWYTDNKPMPAGPRTTFTTAPFYKKDDPLMSSGLLGKVQIIPSAIIKYNLDYK
ncbi:MAG TPA: glycosyl hydrolase, partial [Pelobium sp.]|nr:glycosyl hydrolase [Pelobium sp.]